MDINEKYHKNKLQLSSKLSLGIQPTNLRQARKRRELNPLRSN